jgi:hypothetical protein
VASDGRVEIARHWQGRKSRFSFAEYFVEKVRRDVVRIVKYGAVAPPNLWQILLSTTTIPHTKSGAADFAIPAQRPQSSLDDDAIGSARRLLRPLPQIIR